MTTNIQSALDKSKPAEASEAILLELFCTSHRGDGSEWDKRVEQAWEKYYGYPFESDGGESGGARPSFALYGPPGHGKTASFTQAGKTFAKLMGLNFVQSPPIGFVPTKDDFVFVSIEMAGEVSNQSVGGIPTKASFETSDGAEHAVMDKLISRQFLQLQEAGAGILLFDDFNNAVHSVQNQLLSIAQFRRFQSAHFGQCLVGLTGNLGAADNTEVYSPKLALKTRCQQMYIEDDVKDFIARADAKYAGSTTGFIRAKDIVNAFLSNRTDAFAGDPSSMRVEQGDVYACPRSWENLIKLLGPQMLRVERLGQMGALESQRLAHRIVGGDVAPKFAEYFYQMTSMALPLAKEMLDNGKFSADSEAKFKEKFGHGVSADEQDFSQQFAMAMANSVAERLVEADKQKGEKRVEAIRKIGEAYYGGISYLEDSHRALSMTRLRTRVESAVGNVWASGKEGAKVTALWADLSKGMAERMSKMGEPQEEKMRFAKQVSGIFSKMTDISGMKIGS